MQRVTTRRRRALVPLVGVVAFCAACSSSPPARPNHSGVKVPVTVPANCPIPTSGSPTAHAFIGIKATAKTSQTARQVSAALMIPNSKTMPCASGANYTPGPPVQVDIFFLSGATTADQNTSAATMRASGTFSTVTVQPHP